MKEKRDTPSRKKFIHKPLWDTTSHHPTLPKLEKDITTDICVIGAGITGLSLAYMLSEQGKKVVIVDKGEVGFGETGVTTAHLTYALDDRFIDLVRMHGLKKITFLLDSHVDAIDTIEATVKKEHIDCEFERVDGYAFLGSGDTSETLERELDTLHRLKYDQISALPESPAGSHLGSCLKFPDQAQFHPLKYLNALSDRVIKNGGEIYVNSLVQNLEETQDGVHVKLENGCTIQAQTAVMATNTPFIDKESKMYAKQAAYRTYAIGVEIPKDSVTNALYWDTEEPYHYVRLSAHNMLIVGGEDHKTGQQAANYDPFENLLQWTREKFPMIQESTMYKWSGQIMEPVDRLAFIGLNPGNKRVYVATGFSGSGMTYGVVAAKIITDLIDGKKHPLVELFDPARSVLKGAKRFLKENGNVAAKYIGNLFSKHHESVEELPNGTGMIVGQGKDKTAVFKDKQGKVCKFSATCPHMGCTIGWNHIEGTWDCPCHGSRFDTQGKVLNGPARTHLRS